LSDKKIQIYKVILHVVLYRDKTQISHLKRKYRLAISGPKREEVTGGWRKLHNEELHNL
jgi:hypothetical protein